ncbi:hypothetical protein PoB_004959800 [Plakobranchus ocellatus]|uniref:Uncharacterized protein n=1 Tax=Plakobranchus ocellatus TaxID=259542 RepID=A0AAV4BU04_9GAST|nr:hypothetical protein PoB_004959800 [Plakobranchus ocellatus]
MTGIPYGPEWPTSRQMDSAYTSPTSFVTSPGSSDESPCPSDTDWPSAPSLAATSSPTPEIRIHNGDSRANRREHRIASVHNGASSRELEHRRLHTASPRLSPGGKRRQPSGSEDFSATHSCSHSSSHPSQHRPRPDHHHRHHTCMLNTELDTSGTDYKENRSDRLAQLESPFQSLGDFDDAADASFTPGSVTEGRDSSGLLNGGFLLTRSDSCSSFMSWRSDVEMASLFPEEADSSSHTKCIAK